MNSNPHASTLLAALACALGCSSLRSGASPELPLWILRPSGALHVSYTRPLVAPSRIEGEPYERGQPEIDPAGGRVFVADPERGVFALQLGEPDSAPDNRCP